MTGPFVKETPLNPPYYTLHYDKVWLSCRDVQAIKEQVLAHAHGSVVHIVLDHARHTSTAALAGLILLRRNLLQQNRDLRVAGLAGNIKGLHEIHNLQSALPEWRTQALSAP